MYPTHDASRTGTARVKQEQETDAKIIVNSSMEFGRKLREHEGKSLKQGLTSVENITIELPEGREFPNNR